LDFSKVIPTFVKYGILLNGSSEGADSVVNSLETFFVYACRYGFHDARISEGISSWLYCHYRSLNIKKTQLLLQQESNETRVFAQAIADQTSAALSIVMNHPFGAVPFTLRMNRLGEIGRIGNKYFEKYNASMPSLKPDIRKFIRADLRITS